MLPFDWSTINLVPPTVKLAVVTSKPFPADKTPVEETTTSPAEPSTVKEKPLFVTVVFCVKLPPNIIVPELLVKPFLTGILLTKSHVAFAVGNCILVEVEETAVTISSTD